MTSSADLGGTGKYPNENFEDQNRERFHVNSSWTWVSRSKEIWKLRFKVRNHGPFIKME